MQTKAQLEAAVKILRRKRRIWFAAILWFLFGTAGNVLDHQAFFWTVLSGAATIYALRNFQEASDNLDLAKANLVDSEGK